ncbi:MAG: CotH kinase family protein [Chitinispirillia bacterium]|nr:CotH kinase family protein [Chitinispirillia bacterium]
MRSILIKRVQFFISFILICVSFAFAQNYSGTVLSQSGAPVEGVFVSIGYSEYYTRTDADGRFALPDAAISVRSARPQQRGTAVNARWNFHRRTLDLSGAPGVTSVNIYSLNGRRIVNSKVPPSKIISLPSLSQGIYLLELRGDGGLRTRGRVVLSNKNSSFTFRPMSSAGGSLLLASESALASSSAGQMLIFRHDKYFPVDTVMAGSASGLFIFLEEDPRHVVFDQSRVHEYRFTISSADSLEMYLNGFRVNNNEPDRWKRAAMTYNGVSAGSVVGLRHKGSQYSLPRCFNFNESTGTASGPRTCAKVSFKVKFHEFDRNQRLHALKRINLHSMNADPTKMRDALAYELYREVGIHSPRTSYANVYVNDTHIGLFVAVEDIDGRFTASRWRGSGDGRGHGDGNLYKEVWPDNPRESHYMNALSTNEDVPGVNARRMVDFHNAIARSNESNFVQTVSEFMDFDHFLRYMVVDVAINNWDGIRGWYSDRTALQWAANHNFYLYEEEANNGGKVWLVPWDMDNTFWNVCPYFETAKVPQWNETPEHCGGWMIWGDSNQFIRPPNCDKLTRMMASLFWDRYKLFGGQFLNDQFQTARMTAKIDRHRQLIAAHVAADNAINTSNWQSQVADMRDYMQNHAAKFSNHLHNRKSVVDSSGYTDPSSQTRFLSPVALNNFEFTPAAGGINWVQMFQSQNSEFSISHNTQNPLYGTADLRFDFTFRSTNAPSAWDVWGNFQLAFENPAGVDFTNLREIQMAIRSDRPRNIRIALNNWEVVNQIHGADSEYGWDGVQMTTQTQTIILKMMDLKFPDWASRKPDIKDEALRSVKQLMFAPNARMSGAGFLTADPDIGYFQVDNIRFIYND